MPSASAGVGLQVTASEVETGCAGQLATSVPAPSSTETATLPPASVAVICRAGEVCRVAAPLAGAAMLGAPGARVSTVNPGVVVVSAREPSDGVCETTSESPGRRSTASIGRTQLQEPFELVPTQGAEHLAVVKFALPG